jgi:hypothetical protein
MAVGAMTCTEHLADAVVMGLRDVEDTVHLEVAVAVVA